MSEDVSMPEAANDVTTESTPVVDPPPIPPPPPPPEPTAMFMEAYDCAKNNYNWLKVSSAILTHPQWLTEIPQGRKWTMLHQIVFCGNVQHLSEVLAYQISNENFCLLFKSRDDKTIREVASERAHVHPQMTHYVERLVALDQLLHNARENKWGLVRQFLQQKPEMVNEKPPYKKTYLVHYLAATGQLNIFQELQQFCPFKLNLLVEEKTISEIARDNNHEEFAEYIESLPVESAEAEAETAAAAASAATDQMHFSHTFHDDPGITIFSGNPSSLAHMILTHGGLAPHSYVPFDLHLVTHNLFDESVPLAAGGYSENAVQGASAQATNQQPKPSMTLEEQAEYEKQITDNIKQFSSESLLSAITCSITKSIMRDPVVAADGFTYEREAILHWFNQSNRSPLTNEVLENTELKPNHAIKSILQGLLGIQNTVSASNKSV